MEWFIQRRVRSLACGLILISAAAVRGENLAVPGQPFGVGSIDVSLVGAERLPDWKAVDIRERNGRVFYPALRTGLLPGAAPREGEIPSTVTISFLFKGDAPLELLVRTPAEQPLTVTPRVERPRVYRRQLMRWWRDYNAAVREEAQRNDYPQLVHIYLSSMLGNRLGLQPPLLSRRPAEKSSELQKTVELLAGGEGLRASLIREMMRSDTTLPETADQAVPTAVHWSPVLPPAALPAAPEVEPMVKHVPAECFYIRFGSFPNYLWLNRLLKEYGGDIGRMVTLRGQDANLNERLQRQLALKESKLAEIFGAQVIADVAFIGRDLYLAEGPAMGVLFHANNNLALSTDLTKQRAAALRQSADEGSLLEDVEIAGHRVSFLSTPTNRLRSFYAVDGDFHLVTTSRALVERFYQAGQGDRALADTVEFQQARRVMPLDRGDTIFAYFSSAFFQELVSPQYQIELRRRLQSDTAIELVQLARLAAAAEGVPGDSLDELAAAELLPPGFGRLADGSGPILEEQRVIDSLRGERGSYLPIPDIPLHAVSRREAEWFRSAASYLQQDWRQMDPLIVGIQRIPGGEPDRERIVVDANISPLAEEKYGWILSLLGPPSTHEVLPTEGDIISMQAMVKGGLLSDRVPPHHLFLGIKDSPIPVDPRPGGLFHVLKILQSTPGYLGAWPQLGFLDWLPLGLAGQPDVAGFSSLPLGVWRWQGDGFSVLSFKRDVLEQSVPQLQVVPTDNPAQIRVRVGDLSQSELSGWINAQNYRRAHQASLGNVRLLTTLMQQLKVPTNRARAEAERLVDGELLCALGGQYEVEEHDGFQFWHSSVWPRPGVTDAADYRAPLLGWFRGGQLELVKVDGRLVLHAEIDMQHQANQQKLNLPFLDLFGGRREE